MEIFHCSGNRLTDIEPLVVLEALRECDLSFNFISAIPAGFSSLKRLAELDLSANQVTAVLPLVQLSDLLQVKLDHNPVSPATLLTAAPSCWVSATPSPVTYSPIYMVC